MGKKKDTGPVFRLGLNIGRAGISACEISAKSDGLVLERCARVMIDHTKALPDQISDFFRTEGFQAKEVALSLKGQGVVCRFLELPKMSASDLASAMEFEAEKYLPFTLSEVVIDYQVSTPPGRKDPSTMRILLVAARRKEVERILELLRPSGLRVRIIDLDIFACANALEFQRPEIKTQTVGLIDLGAVDTSICVCEKGTIQFARDVAFGGNDLTELIRRKFSVTTDEAYRIENQSKKPEHVAVVREGLDHLLQEIKVSVNYYFNQRQDAAEIETVYVSGGFLNTPSLFERFQEDLRVPVMRWNPIEKFKLGTHIDESKANTLGPHLAVAAGLALRS